MGETESGAEKAFEVTNSLEGMESGTEVHGKAIPPREIQKDDVFRINGRLFKARENAAGAKGMPVYVRAYSYEMDREQQVGMVPDSTVELLERTEGAAESEQQVVGAEDGAEALSLVKMTDVKEGDHFHVVTPRRDTTVFIARSSPGEPDKYDMVRVSVAAAEHPDGVVSGVRFGKDIGVEIVGHDESMPEADPAS